MWERSDERARNLLLPQSLFRNQRRRRGRHIRTDRGRRLHHSALRPARAEVRRHLGRDLQRCGSAAAVSLLRRGPARASPLRGGPDADNTRAPDAGVDRTRRHAGATMRDLSRADGRQSRGLAEPRRPVWDRDLQGAGRLSLRGAHQRGDGAIRREPDRPGNRRPRGLLRLSAPPARLPPTAAASEAARRDLRRADTRRSALWILPWQLGQQGR